MREFCRNSNSRELLWLVLLSARMKKIHPKMKVLEWSQHFTHYKSMGIFPDAQGQPTHKSLVQSCRISNPFKIYILTVPRWYFFCGSFMFLFCLVFAMFCARLFICALWSPAGKGLTSWLSFVVSSVSLSLSHWYPGSGLVLDCIDS